MHRSKIGLREWAMATYLWATSLKGVSSMKLHRDLGITQKSAYFMAQRLREAWSDPQMGMNGPVEIDESYFGGKRGNMSNSKRKELKETGLGRGPSGKVAVVGAKDRATNKIVAAPVESTDGPTLQGFAEDVSSEDATVYTDEAKAYKGMDRDHESVNRSVSQYVNDKAHTNGIESFWALLKWGYNGTFHHISARHLHRYVNEFATRHNLRPQDTEAIMAETVARMTGKQLTYAELTSKPEKSA